MTEQGSLGAKFMAMRRCLGGCEELFDSNGPWNRICARSEVRNAKLSKREASAGVGPDRSNWVLS